MKLGQMPAAVLRGVIDDAHLADMELRNRKRAEDLIAKLGPKWVCFNNNPPKRKETR